MRTLLLDIETSPHRAYVWGLWDQNIQPGNVVEHGSTLCFAAKWKGERELMFDSVQRSKPGAMLRRAHRLLDEADAVVHFNGKKFDIPVLSGEFVRHGMEPPSPFKHIDLLVAVRRQFRFASNKLDFVAQHLGLGAKTQHKGMALWQGCMAGDAESWRVMERYNKQDVRLLEKLYDRLLPWIPNHPNVGSYTGQHACPNCGGTKLQARGWQITTTRRYRRLQCTECGTWSRDVVSQPGSAKLKAA